MSMDITSGTLDGIFGALGNIIDQRSQLASSAISAGAQRVQNQDFTSALADFKRATAYDPTSSLANVWLGQTYSLMGQTDASIASYKKAVQLDPTNSDTRLALAKAYVLSQQYGNAEQEFQRLAATNPVDPTPPSWLGYIYMNTGRLGQAQEQFQRQIQVAPTDPSGYDGLGLVFQQQGQDDKAIAAFQQAVSIDPSFAEGYANLGQSYLNVGDTDHAQQQVNNLSNLNTSQANQFATNLQLAMFTPQIQNIDPAATTFLDALGPNTSLATLDPSLATPGASHVFTMAFQFNQSMDITSVQNALNWSITKGTNVSSGWYDNSSVSNPQREVSIPIVPLNVRYDPVHHEAFVQFRITQNATGDGVMDPSHWVFRFRGTDIAGNPMDPMGDEYDGARGTGF